MTIGEIVRGVIFFSHPHGSVAQVVLHWILQTAAEDDSDVFDDILAWLTSDLLAAWDGAASDTVTAYQFDADVVNTDGTVDRNIGSDILAVPGAVAEEVTSPGVAMFMQATTGANKTKGRKYWPGLAETHVEDGVITAGALGTLAGVHLQWTETVNVGIGGEAVPGVVSRPTSTFEAFDGGGYFSDAPAYQRRRKLHVGS